MWSASSARRILPKTASIGWLPTRHSLPRLLFALSRPEIAAKSIVAVGLALKRQKERLPHGMFLPWIEAEFGMAERTARRFMEVATAYASKSATVADLTPTALYELAAPSTPQPIRDEVEALLVDGQKVTVADILRSELHLMRVHLTHGLTSSGDRT